MRKYYALALGAMAFISSQSAVAQTYSPAGQTFHATGSLTVKKGLTLTCAADFTLVVDSTGKIAKVTTGSLSGALCGAVTLTNFDWAVSYDGTYVYFDSVAATTITPGNCAPTKIRATWNNASPGSLTFVNATLPPVTPGTGNCVINGTLSLSPALSVTLP